MGVVDVPASTALSLIDVGEDGSGIELDRPLEYAHDGPIVRAVVAGNPEPVPTLDPGVECGVASKPRSRTCFDQGRCNTGNGTCECREGWAPPFCEVSTCNSTCSSTGGRCEFTADRSKMVCKCKFGFGGENCDDELCPIMDGKVCGGPYRGKGVRNSSASMTNTSTWTPAFCHCKTGLGGADCSIATGCGGSGHDCGSNGRCVLDSCMCNPGWGGARCDVQVCPNNCTGVESGTCAVVTANKRSQRKCVCKLGHKGKDCSMPDPCAEDMRPGFACSGHG